MAANVIVADDTKTFWDRTLDYFYDLVASALKFLPDSPFVDLGFQEQLKPFEETMQAVNYFVPVGPCLVITVSWLGAVSVWYIVRWSLRIARYID